MANIFEKTQVINIRQGSNTLRNPIFLVNENGDCLGLRYQDKYFFKYLLGNLNIKFDKLYKVVSELEELVDEIDNIETYQVGVKDLVNFLVSSKLVMVTENWKEISSAKREWAKTVLIHCLAGYSELNAKSLATHQCKDAVIAEIEESIEDTFAVAM